MDEDELLAIIEEEIACSVSFDNDHALVEIGQNPRSQQAAHARPQDDRPVSRRVAHRLLLCECGRKRGL